MELQYICSVDPGTGYRVIAWRVDGFVDVYDDISIHFDADENFDIAGKGLHRHVQTKFKNVNFSNDNGLEHISFEFNDLQDREIKFSIKENRRKKTTPINLLAPVGAGSSEPKYLPLFFLYDFDFIKRKATAVDCFIDGNKIKIDKFPFPMNNQLRYFIRYSENCNLIEFASSDYRSLKDVEVDEQLRYIDNNIIYSFDIKGALSSIKTIHFVDNIEIKFNPSLDIVTNCMGDFSITAKKEIGNISGIYRVDSNNGKSNVKFACIDGWKGISTSFISKCLFNNKSVFTTWIKKYELEVCINFDDSSICSRWMNNK